MTRVDFDASALSKRYVLEPGTAGVHRVFARVPRDRMHVLAAGMGEVASVLVRRRNAGSLSATAFARALAAFRAEVVDDPAVTKEDADAGFVR